MMQAMIGEKFWNNTSTMDLHYNNVINLHILKLDFGEGGGIAVLLSYHSCEVYLKKTKISHKKTCSTFDCFNCC